MNRAILAQIILDHPRLVRMAPEVLVHFTMPSGEVRPLSLGMLHLGISKQTERVTTLTKILQQETISTEERGTLLEVKGLADCEIIKNYSNISQISPAP